MSSINLLLRAEGALSLQDIARWRNVVAVALDSVTNLVSQGLPVDFRLSTDLDQLTRNFRPTEWTSEDLVRIRDDLHARRPVTPALERATPVVTQTTAAPVLGAKLDQIMTDTNQTATDIGPAISLGGNPPAAIVVPETDKKPRKSAAEKETAKQAAEAAKARAAEPPKPAGQVQQEIGGGIELDLEDDEPAQASAPLAQAEDIDIDLGADEAPLSDRNAAPGTRDALLQRVADVLGEEIPGTEVAADDLVQMVTITREQAEKAPEGDQLKAALPAIKAFMSKHKIGRVSETPAEHREPLAELILAHLKR